MNLFLEKKQWCMNLNDELFFLLSVLMNDDLVNADTTINEEDEWKKWNENNENTSTPNLSDDPYLQ